MVYKKSQSSVEYLILMSFLIGLISITSYLVYQNTAIEKRNIIAKRFQEIGNDIISTAEIVYYQGHPTKTTLKETFPSELRNISIKKENKNFVLIMNYENLEIIIPTNVNISLDRKYENVTQGKKYIEIYTKETPGYHVEISIK